MVLLHLAFVAIVAAEAPSVGRHYREVHELTALNFEKAMQPGSSWLVLFYAPWCGHCKKLAPAYEKLAEHYHRATPQFVHIGRVDATQHSNLATQFDIKGYPTLILLRGGERIADYSGARTFEGLAEFVDEQLALPPSAPRRPSAPKKGGGGAKGNARGAPAARPSKRGAAAYYLYMKQSVIWLLTEADPVTAALSALAVAVSLGLGLIGLLVATTAPSPR